MNSCLKAEDLGLCTRGHQRLQGVSFALQPQEILVVCGPNGAGKSTLLDLLSGDQQPTRGQVWLQDQPLSSFSAGQQAHLRARLAQDYPVHFDFLAQEVVAFGRFSWPESEAETQAIVAQAMQAAGCAHLAQRAITQLSGGERQRVQLARVLAQVWQVEQGVLLLDEPLSAQDLGQQQWIFRQLKQLARQKNWGILCVLHDLNLAQLFADRVLLLAQGQQLAWGPPQEVLCLERLSLTYQAELTAYQHPMKAHQLVMLDD